MYFERGSRTDIITAEDTRAILKGWAPEKWIQFGWASGALATTFLTDYGQPADEEQVWSIWEGNARVKR